MFKELFSSMLNVMGQALFYAVYLTLVQDDRVAALCFTSTGDLIAVHYTMWTDKE